MQLKGTEKISESKIESGVDYWGAKISSKILQIGISHTQTGIRIAILI